KTKQTLQRKGTRSATRRLIVLSKRERRFNADINHCIAKRVVISGSLIGLENITHNPDQIKLIQLGHEPSRQLSKPHINKRIWEFTKLHDFIDYKAVLGGALAIRVDADFTSQSCPRCGHTSKANRPNQGLDFDCMACGYKLHADLVGAKNIALRTLLLRQDFERTGRLSTVPDVSQDETKTLD
ncbi:MAG: transposase, partial [Moorea sp. SIO2I5]|nr:transposase [Moorena sp. SIO2I5]